MSTETNDYVRLLFAKIGRVICQTCGHEVRRESPQSAAEYLAKLPDGTRFLVGFDGQSATVGTAGATAGLPSSANLVLGAHCWTSQQCHPFDCHPEVR